VRLSKKQKRIAKAAPPFGRITGADFKKLKRKKNGKKKKQRK
jgi:hypothetical protein